MRSIVAPHNPTLMLRNEGCEIHLACCRPFSTSNPAAGCFSNNALLGNAL
jgi:hypothetical protein